MKITDKIEVKILTLDFYYIVIETKYTKHHIERLLPTCKDRGRIKWIAETNYDCHDNIKDTEAQRSHIDYEDIFPRLYFAPNAFLNEFQCWLNARGLEVTASYEGEI